MKTTDLIEQLNAALADMRDTRVNDFYHLHEGVRHRVDPLLEPHDLHYRTWEIADRENHIGVIKLEIDFTDDKGWKNHRRGRLNSAWFTLIEQAETVPQLITAARIAELRSKARDQEKAIDQCTFEIHKHTAVRDKLLREIQEMEAKL